MRKSREARGNESAEPSAKSDKPKQKTEAQELADKMRKSREARGNESAEPESRGGGEPVNAKTGKPSGRDQDSAPEQTEAQKLAEKMRKSREARGNESAEPESRGDKPKQKTEAQGLAEKMKQSRGDRSNESAQPESKGGGRPVNAKTGKPSGRDQDSAPEQTEAQKLAEKMRKSREARGNESAEPESRGDKPKQKTEAQGLAEKMKQSRGDRSNESAQPESKGGGRPVNVKTPKVVEKESGPELNEAQKMAQKMKKSRAGRDNVVAEAESKGGGKAVNVKAKPKPKTKIKPLTLDTPNTATQPDLPSNDQLLGAAKKLNEAISDLTESVKAVAKKGSRVNAMTGQEVSPAVKKLSTHTRTNVDPVLASGSKAKASGKTRTVATPNVAQNKPSGHSR